MKQSKQITKELSKFAASTEKEILQGISLFPCFCYCFFSSAHIDRVRFSADCKEAAQGHYSYA